MDLDNEGSPADLEGNYIDDDVFGLNIKKESEELRQQELLIEEEVRDVRLHFLALAKTWIGAKARFEFFFTKPSLSVH